MVEEINIDNIKFIKLTTGESILAYVHNYNYELVKCEFPLKIISSYNEQDNRIEYGLIKFSEMVKDDLINLDAKHIITIADADENAINMYMKFAENIVLEDMKNSSETNINTYEKPELIWQNDDHPLFKDNNKNKFHIIENESEELN